MAPGRPLSPGKPRRPGGPSLPDVPCGPGSPCAQKQTIFVARITNQFTAVRYSCSGLVWVYKVSSFMQRSEYELKIYLSIYVSSRLWCLFFASKTDMFLVSIPWKTSSGRKHSWEIATCFFFSFLHKFFNRLPWSNSIWNSPAQQCIILRASVVNYVFGRRGRAKTLLN